MLRRECSDATLALARAVVVVHAVVGVDAAQCHDLFVRIGAVTRTSGSR